MFFLVLLTGIGAAVAQSALDGSRNTWIAGVHGAVTLRRSVPNVRRAVNLKRRQLPPYSSDAADPEKQPFRQTARSSIVSSKQSSVPISRYLGQRGPSSRQVTNLPKSSASIVRRLAGVDPPRRTSTLSATSSPSRNEEVSVASFARCASRFPPQCGISDGVLLSYLRVHVAAIWADYVVLRKQLEEAEASGDIARARLIRSDMLSVTQSHRKFVKCLQQIARACGQQLPPQSGEVTELSSALVCDRTVFARSIVESCTFCESLFASGSRMEPWMQLALICQMLCFVENTLTCSATVSNTEFAAVRGTHKRLMVKHGLDLCITLARILLGAFCLTTSVASSQEEAIAQLISRTRRLLVSSANGSCDKVEISEKSRIIQMMELWLLRLKQPRLIKAVLLFRLKNALRETRPGVFPRDYLMRVLTSYLTMLTRNVGIIRAMHWEIEDGIIPVPPPLPAIEAVLDWLERVLESRALTRPTSRRLRNEFIRKALLFLASLTIWPETACSTVQMDRVALLRDSFSSLRRLSPSRHRPVHRLGTARPAECLHRARPAVRPPLGDVE